MDHANAPVLVLVLAHVLVLVLSNCGGPAPDPGSDHRPDPVPASMPTRPAEWQSASDVPVLDTLPAAAVALLRGRMVRHGQDLTALHAQVRAHNFDAIADTARAIANEPKIARPDRAEPDADHDELNATLPPAFYDLQDALQATAKALDATARARDADATEQAYTKLGDVCARCHETFAPLEWGDETGEGPAESEPIE